MARRASAAVDQPPAPAEMQLTLDGGAVPFRSEPRPRAAARPSDRERRPTPLAGDVKEYVMLPKTSGRLRPRKCRDCGRMLTKPTSIRARRGPDCLRDHLANEAARAGS